MASMRTPHCRLRRSGWDGGLPRRSPRAVRAGGAGSGGFSPRAAMLAAVVIAAAATACGGEAPKPSAPAAAPAAPASPPKVRVYVTNEWSGDLTVINGDTQEAIGTFKLGKRRRGIQASPDGKSLFVALSGSPPAPPGTDEKSLPPPDRAADGIGEIDANTYQVK